MIKGYINYEIGSRFDPGSNPLVEEAKDKKDAILLHVQARKNVYMPYKDYEFIGRYDSYLNYAIKLLLHPREEKDTTGMYQHIIPKDVYIDNITDEYTFPMIRSVYALEKVSDNVYKQIYALPYKEEYRVTKYKEDYLYIGKQGAFVLSQNEHI